MNLKHISLAVGLAGLALMLTSAKAKALNWNFNYSLPLNADTSQPYITGSGTLSYTGSGDGTFNITSLSVTENGVSGTYTLDNSSNYFGSAPNYSSLGQNQIQVTSGNVSNWNFYATDGTATADNVGRNFLRNGNSTYATTSYGLTYTSTGTSLTKQYQDNSGTGTTFAVPFEFSPSQGIALGLPLFISLRMLKKRLQSNKESCVAKTGEALVDVFSKDF